MYYIAGLTLPLPSTRAVEAFVTFTTFRFLQSSVSRIRATAPVAEAEAGTVRSLPTSFIGKVVSPVHGFAIFVPPAVYILSVSVNRFMQPSWMQRMSLPNNYIHDETKVALRIAACASTFVFLRVISRALIHLGNQWHAIGVRSLRYSLVHQQTDQLPSSETGEIQDRADWSICSSASSSVYVSRLLVQTSIEFKQ